MIRPAGTMPTPAVIAECVKEHQRGVARLAKLKRDYIGGKNSFKKERENPLVPNNIVVAPNAYYITTVANGFTFANPVTYSGNDTENLLDELQKAKIAAHDAELGEDLSVYGRAYELVHMSKLPAQHVKLNNLAPECSFVVFSNEIDPEPTFGVFYHPTMDALGGGTGYEINVYDAATLYVYHAGTPVDPPALVRSAPHYAGQMPLIEYKNNDEGIGDFERVDTLIEAYNRLQSDRLDDKDQFIDAILLVYGARLTDKPSHPEEETDETMARVLKAMREYKIIDELPQDAHAEYLKNALDEASVETLRQALKQDISKFSMIPELTDESFAGNVSGVAMEYKTLGLKWLANMKRRMFKKSLDRRLQIMNSYMEKLGRGFDWTDADVTFSDALPVDRASLMPYAQAALSRRTMISALANAFGVTDIEDEMKLIATEEQEATQRQQTLLNNGQDFGEGDGG